MKVLFTVSYPLAWAKGGFTVQVENTAKELKSLGVDVEWVDFSGTASQRADIVHYWGPPSSEYMWNASLAMGMKRIITFLSPHGFIQPGGRHYLTRFVRNTFLKRVGEQRLFGRMGIGINDADAFIFLNEAERRYTTFMYGWPQGKCYVVPEGVDECFFRTEDVADVLDGLLYPSYICPRKNQVEVARIAKQEKISVFFAGGAQGESPDYFEQFKKELDDEYAVWLGEISDRQRLAALYRSAYGTFLASDYDNQGIILLESLACGRPVMGPDLPSLRSYFGEHIQYCPSAKSGQFVDSLKNFDQFCRSRGRQNMNVLSWKEVGRRVLNVYQTVLR